MEQIQFKQSGIILFCVEDPISQLLRKINGQYYSVVGFYYRNPDLKFILGDTFGVHMSRHLDNSRDYGSITTGNFSKLISNIVVLDYMGPNIKFFVEKILKTTRNLGSHKPVDRINDYHWMTSIFGYQLPNRNESSCYEVINHILTEKKSDDLLFRTKLVQTPLLSTPKHYSLKPPKELFKHQQSLISASMDYIHELANIFSELMIKSPPFYQIVASIDQTRVPAENLYKLMEQIQKIHTDVDNNEIPIIRINDLIKSVNNIATDLGIELRLELLQTNKSIGSVISASNNSVDNIPLRLKSGRNIVIPTVGYDISEFTPDECREILSVVDAKSHGEVIYEKLKIDLTRRIADKN